ncbi:hypothetical protein J422_01258 [Methanocaldococcus villosus KIN24-T80]|uniref:Uncharacterized protein n=1 Tax=Methanocaldococcus villosus KIN24-T80 TaxID=1069083 RepID=N6VRX6_9EURY|nr:DUF128 domain-containing protein [Methanocaldococcus villosus]ENN96625.1 hypothetical protein J422_01258 [Methanocaldococcus villosus KIN24-T80]
MDLDRKLIEILDILSKYKEPVGATIIAKELSKRGYKIGERAVRYHLKILDSLGLTKKVGYVGRIITEKGLEELRKADVFYRLGSIYSNILEKMLSFNYYDRYAIVNRAYIYADFNVVIKEIKKIYNSGFAVGDRVGIVDKGKYVELYTLCSLNFDNILIKNGILPTHVCGGIVKYEDGEPVKFEEIIYYKATSIDPLKVFIKEKKTDVVGILEEGNGYLPVNFRYIPKSSMEKFERILKNDELKCVISYGEENVLGLKVDDDSIGIALIGGLSPIAVFTEKGYYADIQPMELLVKIDSLHKLEKNERKIVKKKSNYKIKTIFYKMVNAMSMVDYDIDKHDGKVIVNICYIDKKYADDALDLLKEAYKNNLGIGDKFGFIEEKDKIKIQTLCSITIDGILLKHSLPTIPKYGGVLEIKNEKKRFIDIIAYNGSSLDPHIVFFDAVDCESTILAGFREFHRIIKDDIEEVLDRLNWNCVIGIGEPNNEIFGINVEKDMCGIVYNGGLNPIVLLKENEIPVEIKQMHEVVDYSKLISYKEI